MHKLLARQLKRTLGTTEVESPEWRAFIEAVDDAYREADEDRRFLERTMDLVSSELMTQNERLRTDIRERERLEIELAQAHKMEAVGQLAAGVAHEINTPVQFVADSLHFLREAFADLGAVFGAVGANAEPASLSLELVEDLQEIMDEVPRALDRMNDGLKRVADIVGALKTFAHPDAPEKAPCDINYAIDTTLVMARHETKHIAEVETVLGDIPLVSCHVGQIQQVLLNLIVNAAHAIVDAHNEAPDSGTRASGADGRGKIVIRTSCDGGWVVVSVSDTGCGIPQPIQNRVFEPFFTTKEVGRGSGQGLAIARSIVVEKHGGTISFDSVAGRGTTFFVSLPVVPPTPAAKDSVARRGSRIAAPKAREASRRAS